ncbi:MAG: UTRA domain-containing protein [Streptosporangiales bacterium]|nr:UTRA domain-containing protein [Streptosporangiales bacterium]
MAEPIYRQIADALRKEITSGDLKPGVRLPKEARLEKRFAASRNTIRLALAELANQGLVYIQHGKGTFVREDFVPVLVKLSSEEGASAPDKDSYVAAVTVQGRRPDLDRLVVETQRANEFVAERLGIDLGSPVVLRTFWRLIDGQPWSIQTSYYPMDIAQDTEIMLPDDITRGTLRVLAELGHAQVGYHDRIWARMPQPEEIEFFKLRSGVPVVVLNRTAFSAERAVRLTRTVYAADRNRLAYDIGDVPPEGREDEYRPSG